MANFPGCADGIITPQFRFADGHDNRRNATVQCGGRHDEREMTSSTVAAAGTSSGRRCNDLLIGGGGATPSSGRGKTVALLRGMTCSSGIRATAATSLRVEERFRHARFRGASINENTSAFGQWRPATFAFDAGSVTMDLNGVERISSRPRAAPTTSW
jgi:hypothetical protein